MSKQHENPTIRQTTSEDVPTILGFIHEAALEQGYAKAIQATESSLRETLDFSTTDVPQRGFARAIFIVAPDSEVAGMAVYFYNYSTWIAKPGICLEDFFVRRQYRRNGYGRLLIAALTREVQKIGGGRMEWLCSTSNHRALSFYNGLGAKKMTEWVSLRLDGEALAHVAGVE